MLEDTGSIGDGEDSTMLEDQRFFLQEGDRVEEDTGAAGAGGGIRQKRTEGGIRS